jgi:YD repeat-containing protein
MKRFLYIVLTLIIIASPGCREKYTLPFNQPATGYLVVEGFINSGQGPTNIRLSRTAKLDSSRYPVELKAIVRVESETNQLFPLVEKGQGLYSADQLTLDAGQKYRLYIRTFNGKEYTTAFMTVRNTPAVDSINWQQTADGVEIFVNTHDPQNTTKYYRWDYDETYEYTSVFHSILQFTYNAAGAVRGVTDRDPASTDKLFTCWKTLPSTRILVGTSTGLTRDSIHLLTNFIPRGDVKLSIRYSIIIRQYAISFEEFDFLQRMKKNTESLGSIFDAQPSEIKGNIRSTIDPSDIVVGFVGISNSTQKRIFITRTELQNWGFSQSCYETVVKNDPDSLAPYRNAFPTTPAEYSPTGAITYVNITDPSCVDCLLKGGVNTKPSFWP